jgi:hypothetical protein
VDHGACVAANTTMRVIEVKHAGRKELDVEKRVVHQKYL